MAFTPSPFLPAHLREEGRVGLSSPSSAHWFSPFFLWALLISVLLKDFFCRFLLRTSFRSFLPICLIFPCLETKRFALISQPQVCISPPRFPPSPYTSLSDTSTHPPRSLFGSAHDDFLVHHPPHSSRPTASPIFFFFLFHSSFLPTLPHLLRGFPPRLDKTTSSWLPSVSCFSNFFSSQSPIYLLSLNVLSVRSGAPARSVRPRDRIAISSPPS